LNKSEGEKKDDGAAGKKYYHYERRRKFSGKRKKIEYGGLVDVSTNEKKDDDRPDVRSKSIGEG
jgi:hypothetical protein